MCSIVHKEHQLYTQKMTKVALSPHDDKRMIDKDKVNTMAYGHYKTLKQSKHLTNMPNIPSM